MNLPKRVITLDLDGTVFDPWACCGQADRTHLGTAECRHLRIDTLREIRPLLLANPGCKIVVLSWRAGLTNVTLDWLRLVGIATTHAFIPGSADVKALGAVDAGQVGFKRNVAMALQSRGVEIVASFDDNPNVIEALGNLGIDARRVEHLVEVHCGKVGPDPLFDDLPDWDAVNRFELWPEPVCERRY